MFRGFKIKRAHRELRKEYASNGLCAWDVKNKDSRYRLGITLSWKGKYDEVVDREIATISRLTRIIGEKFDLDTNISIPIFSAGGAYAVYVGLI